MRGKELLEKVGILITILEKISLFVPKIIFNFIYDISSIFEGKFALLIRYLYVRKYSHKCGKNIYIGKYVTLKNLNGLTLGDNISIHAGCYIDAYGGINISSDVSIANQCSLISFNHTYNNQERPIKYNPIAEGYIQIEEDVWIGNGVRILPNVVIGKRSIIAAGAVVNKKVPSRVICGGVPAEILKQI